jgi:hypothetical protein
VNRSALVLVSAALSLSGCYTTTIIRQTPAAPATVEYDDKWHHGFVWGIAEVSGPYDLKKICPNGWAEIKTETSFVNGFVDAVTSGIYSPQSVWIRCAASPAPASASAVAAKPEAVAQPATSAKP